MTSRQSSHSSRTFSSRSGNNGGRDKRVTDDFWDFDLPISRKGRFFDDSFFESSRFDFDKKVNEILGRIGEEDRLQDRWDDDDFRPSTNFNRYRNLRARDMKDDNQAMTVTSDDTAHKIVLDVQDFVNGETKVKVIGELELAVEGRLDDKRSFRRCFTLPQNTDMEAVSSVMSADGILTITAPQKSVQAKQGTTLPVQVTADSTTATTQSSAATTHASTATATSTVKQREAQQETEAKGVTEKTVAADVNQLSSGVTGDVQQSSQSQSVVSSQTEATSASSAAQRKGIIDSEVKAAAVGREGSQNKTISTQTSYERESENQRLSQQGRRRSALPITRRGQFFNDSYFEDTWKDYQDAVRGILAKWDDESAAPADDMTCYRKLRSRDMRDENQAITSAEDSSSYKFVLDVHDFVEGGDISVNVVDETELVVEGQVERDTGDSRGSDHFLRRFVLPQDVQLDSISSVMSSDGVLTVIAPKKSSMQQVSGSSEAAEQQQSAVQVEKVSKSLAEESMSAATSQQGTVIPVQFDDSSDNVNILQAGQEISVGKAADIRSDAADQTKTQACKSCATGESETAAIHVEEDADDDDSKSGMASLRKLLEEDESYIKHKNKAIPIDMKTLSFRAADYSKWHEYFAAAVKEVLIKFNEPSSSEGDLAAYRQLRQRDLKLENQAAYVDENPQAYTVVLDVYDFLDGKLSAEVKEGRELIVRGTAQRMEGTSLVTLTFVRPFKLPGNADLKNIAACLTSDGILLINIPRIRLPYDLPDVGGIKTKETRPRLGTPSYPCRGVSSDRDAREASSDLDGVTYRISPHRGMKGHESSPVTKEVTVERQ